MFLSCLTAIDPDQGLALGLFLAGAAGGFTHCVAMCGPFVMAQTDEQPNTFQGPTLRKLAQNMLLPYHFGRMTTYVVLAILLNTILSIGFLSLPLKNAIEAPLLFLTGIIFLISALPRLNALAPWVVKIRLPIPSGWVEHIATPFFKRHTPISRYMLGMVLGLMPCGLVVAALIASSMADTPLQAGLAMGLFAIGTMPALFLLATGGQILRHRFPISFSKVQTSMMLLSGIWLCALAGFIIF